MVRVFTGAVWCPSWASYTEAANWGDATSSFLLNDLRKAPTEAPPSRAALCFTPHSSEWGKAKHWCGAVVPCPVGTLFGQGQIDTRTGFRTPEEATR